MKKNQWDLIKSVVDQVLSLPGSKRNTFLNRLYRNQPEISTEIKNLLLAIRQAKQARFMQPLRQDYQELIADLSEELDHFNTGKDFIGQSVGAYRITEVLGGGGMGIVYKAARAVEDFNHTVAIKLIKKGLDSEENIRRFRMEREILAGLCHPNIPQLYGGGFTRGGTPYLVMEYIDGIHIDRYSNEKTLTINERLNLFKDVCRAIQFAHTNLVVHCDLKAKNIYVTAEGVVKILDFGIAKRLDTRLGTISGLETKPGQKFWTPQYGAPEQVRGEPVTIATDIYALGILLHKLLTDTYPFDLEGKSIVEIEQVINEMPPVSLSKSLAHHPNMQTCANRRKSTGAELIKTLCGDLEALVLKAIRKEPVYRYGSVSQLRDGVQHYQSGLPLPAGKDKLPYRTRKFIRRYKPELSLPSLY